MTGAGGALAARRRSFLLLAGIVLVAINLRTPLASVGPLVGEIGADTGLSHAAIGLLTTLPLIAFGLVSVLSPLVTGRIGIGGALGVALVLLAAGTALRAVPSIALLFGGTVLLGIGIAFGNVLLPTLVKRDFPLRSGAMTSVYSSVMAIGAAVAAGVSVPLSRSIGWQGALGIWALPAVVAFFVWLPQLRTDGAPVETAAPPAARLAAVLRSRLAWQIALFMGFQSLTFYIVLAWLPDLLQTRGMSAVNAGWMLAISQATGIAGSATIPIRAGRAPDQRTIVWALGLVEAVALGGLYFDSGVELTVVWVSLLGFVLGGTFGLALLFLVVRSSSTETTTRLSGMAQSIGYLLAATGPVVFGMLYDLSGGWDLPLLLLAAVLAGKVLSGVRAGRPGYVGRSG